MKSLHKWLGAILISAIIAGCIPLTPQTAGQLGTPHGRRISGRVLWGSTPAHGIEAGGVG
jgi:hypothetical protein